ncbi:MAG: sorbosone dehydrogenase family protein, partial [bacterium]|nr:sorbosone dehydrogenase family protein [bacterium]
MSQLSRILLVVLVVCGGTCAACSIMLPERWAVNAPMLSSIFGWGADPPDAETFRQRIQVAASYGVGIFAEVPQARWLEPTAAGDLLVSLPRQGRILLLERDADGDGRADGQRELLTDLDRPHGMDLHNGWLYVAEASAVFRIRFDETQGQVSGEPESLVEGLPEGGNHWTRTVGIGPDGDMYVSVGSSCNVCIEQDERRAAILRFPAEGGTGVIHARGLRNAVGFAWQPSTGDLYATDNGRDLLGDDIPPGELDLVVAGGDYGWPFAHGYRVVDPDVGAGHEARVEASIPPAHAFAAHNAPLGLTFLGKDEPDDYA